MIGWLERRRWKSENFFIAAGSGVHRVAGWTYKGIGIYQRQPNHWSITHLGTGHKFFFVHGKLERVMRISRRIADAADWHFNTMPQNPEVYLALMEIVRGEYLKYKSGKSLYVAAYQEWAEYNEISAAAAGYMNGVGQ